MKKTYSIVFIITGISTMNGIQIFYKNINGKSITIDAQPTTTIGEIKKKIYGIDKLNLVDSYKHTVDPENPHKIMRLTFGGKNLIDKYTLRDYKIEEGHMLQYYLPLFSCAKCDCQSSWEITVVLSRLQCIQTRLPLSYKHTGG